MPAIEDQGHQIERRRGRSPDAARSQAACVLDRQLDQVGSSQLEIDRLVPISAAHLQLDGIEIRPAAPVIFVSGEHRAPARLPPRNTKRPRARSHAIRPAP